jgi:hypothetical protein
LILAFQVSIRKFGRQLDLKFADDAATPQKPENSLPVKAA